MYTKPMHEKRGHETKRRAGRYIWESLEVKKREGKVAIKLKSQK